MRRLIQALLDRITARLSPQFRTLHQQFLLRVVDLEALSIEADIPNFLGQFAGILIMISLVHGLGVLFFPPPPSLSWSYEQSRISDMLLVIGLCTILMWDTTFPDKRDVMVLAPLPIFPRIILMAKIAASATVLGIAVVALNCASSVGQSVVFGAPAGGLPGMLRFFFAYWFTMLTAAAFLYCASPDYPGSCSTRFATSHVPQDLRNSAARGLRPVSSRTLSSAVPPVPCGPRRTSQPLAARRIPHILVPRAPQSAEWIIAAGSILARASSMAMPRRRGRRGHGFAAPLLRAHNEEDRGRSRPGTRDRKAFNGCRGSATRSRTPSSFFACAPLRAAVSIVWRWPSTGRSSLP